MTRKDKISLFLFVILLALTVIMAKPSRLFAQTTIAYDDNDNGALFEAIALGNASHDTVYHCEFAIDTFTITNTGDTILDDIVIGSANFYGVINSAYSIPPECIYFTPSYLSELSPGSTVTIEAHIYVPCGLFAQDYKGKVYARDDDGYPLDTIELWITVLPRYDLDISDNEQDLIANTLFLNELPGNSDSGLFLLINPNSDGMNVDPDSFGNADLTNLTYSATNLVGPGPDITTANISIIPTPLILASGCAVALLYMVDIPDGQITGLYEGMVYVTSPGEDESGDSFYVNLNVGPFEAITMTDPPDFDADHGTSGTTSFRVTNIGNDWLDNIIFTSTDFIYGEGEHIIPSANVTFAPTDIELLGPGDTSGLITINVFSPLGTHEGHYTAIITSKDDDGYPIATQSVILTVNPSYDLDISDNDEDVISNTISLQGYPGQITEKKNFLTINPSSDWMNVDPDCFGNADYNVTYRSTNLVFDTDSIPSFAVTITPSISYIASGDVEIDTLFVTIPNDTTLDYGNYTGYVTAYADTGGLVVCSDSFNLVLTVCPEGITEFSDTTQESTYFISLSRPNPFSEKTTIDISLKLLWSNGAGRLQTTDQIQWTSVCIYDLSGRLIRTLPLPSSLLTHHKIIWDGRDDSGRTLPCGVYFLKFDAEKYTETQKLIKVR